MFHEVITGETPHIVGSILDSLHFLIQFYRFVALCLQTVEVYVRGPASRCAWGGLGCLPLSGLSFPPNYDKE